MIKDNIVSLRIDLGLHSFIDNMEYIYWVYNIHSVVIAAPSFFVIVHLTNLDDPLIFIIVFDDCSYHFVVWCTAFGQHRSCLLSFSMQWLLLVVVSELNNSTEDCTAHPQQYAGYTTTSGLHICGLLSWSGRSLLK